MYVNTYREYGIYPNKVSTLSAAELLRNGEKAHFASFSVDLVGVVSDRGDGKYHIDMLFSSSTSSEALSPEFLSSVSTLCT